MMIDVDAVDATRLKAVLDSIAVDGDISSMVIFEDHRQGRRASQIAHCCLARVLSD